MSTIFAAEGSATPIFYGHACLKQYSPKGTAVLMDPWFSHQGAFFGSWFQFPENAPLLDQALEDVVDICVSHNHADHFDPETLRYALSVNPGLNLHIPKYPTDWFFRLIKRRLPGYIQQIFVHEPFAEFSVAGGIDCFFVPEESPSELDSAIVSRTGDVTLVNLNDSRLNTEQLNRIHDLIGNVKFLALQGSGASEYPITYTYPEKEMRMRCSRKRRDKLEHCVRLIETLQPERILFFAGPPVFLDDEFRRFNERTPYSVFPDQLDILRYFERHSDTIAARALFLMPGDGFDDEYLWTGTDLQAERLHPYTRKSEYLELYREKRRNSWLFEFSDPIDSALLLEHFSEMPVCSPYLSGKINGDVTFVVKDRSSARSFTVDFARCCARAGASATPLYTITVPASSMAAVLAGKATWDDILLSLRIEIDERTSNYIPHLKPLLRYMDREVFTLLERYEKDLQRVEAETSFMNVTLGRRIFRIQRFCPHAGTDLRHHGRVNDDGTITCLAHRLCFDMTTGECINARGYRLEVRNDDQEGLREESVSSASTCSYSVKWGWRRG